MAVAKQLRIHDVN